MFLLTCLLRGMTVVANMIGKGQHVSTHMPLARHDYAGRYRALTLSSFYSHASCEA